MPQIDTEADEALVLFELLSRYSDSGTRDLRLEFPGERTALMSLLPTLRSSSLSLSRKIASRLGRRGAGTTCGAFG